MRLLQLGALQSAEDTRHKIQRRSKIQKSSPCASFDLLPWDLFVSCILHLVSSLHMFTYDFLGKNDPAVFKALQGEMLRQREGVGTYCLGKLRLTRGDGSDGNGVQQQIQRRVPGQALLRRTGVHGSGGDACDRAQSSSSSAPMPTSSRTRAAPPTSRCTLRFLEPGDCVLGMDLSHGGHLSHGHPVTYLTKIFRFVRYG